MRVTATQLERACAGLCVFVSPRGELSAEAGGEEEVLTADFDPGAVRAARTEFSGLADRVLK